MSILLNVVTFLPIICGEYPEVQLISKLNKFYNFDHNIFLRDTSVDINRFINNNEQRQIAPTSLYIFESINGNITGMENLTRIKSKNTFVIVSTGGSSFTANYNLLKRIKKIQLLQMTMKIGLFFHADVSSEDLQKLFEWCWRHRMINIFVATSGDSLNIFTFNPFGTLNVINITGSETFQNFFMRQDCNFQQHPLRAVRFFAVDYFWPILFRAMNASWTELPRNASFTSEVIENQPDFYIGITISVYPPNPMAIVMYIKTLIVVPEAMPYGEFTAYLKAITKDAFFGYSFLIIIGVMLTLSTIRYVTKKKNFNF